MLAASQSVLLSTYGGLEDVEARLNNTTAKAAACDALMLFAYREPHNCLVTAQQTQLRLTVRGRTMWFGFMAPQLPQLALAAGHNTSDARGGVCRRRAWPHAWR